MRETFLEHVVIWLPRGLEERALDLPLSPPVRALRTSGGLLLRGKAESRTRLRLARAAGARVFLERDPGLWTEAPRSRRASPLHSRPGKAFLLLSSGTVLEVDDPSGWEPASAAMDASWPARGPAAPPSPSPFRSTSVTVRLVPARRGEGRDGVLWRPGEGERIHAHVRGLRREELSDLRLGEAEEGWAWLFAPRGLAREFPEAGRALRNAGTAIEPLLIPADRAPFPRLAAVQLRRLFSAEEGHGVIWWDAAGGEEHAIFLRSALTILDPGIVDGRRW